METVFCLALLSGARIFHPGTSDRLMMILNRFFKPKWQHPNPEIRIQALQGLVTSDPILLQAAREDQNPSVRRAILHRLADLGLLQEIATQDPEVGVRETAEARFRKLMTGQESNSPDLEDRLAILIQSSIPGLGEFLALHAVEPKLRAAALEAVEQDTLLGDIAINDPASEVRLTALERIGEETSLRRVIKHTLKRDKRVSRRARERLQILQTKREQAARREQLCLDMEALAGDLTREPDAGRFQKLEQAWEAQEPADVRLQERYRHAREQFLNRLHESAARRKQRLELGQSLEQLLASLQAQAEPSPDLAATIENYLQAIYSPPPRSALLSEAEEQRLSQLVQAIRDRERVLYRNHERAERLRGLLRQAHALLQQAGEVRDRDLTDLTKQWSSLERPEASYLMTDLQAQFEAVLDQFQARLRQQEEQRDQEREEIEALVHSVEQSLTQGSLAQAISLHNQARQRLKHNISLSRKQMSALEHRLQACTPHLGELRNWRRWGTNRARENLCEEVEGLIGLEKDPVEIAQQIKRARATWQALHGTAGSAPRSLWQRFNDACERAYAPCQAYFESQARERQENLEKKRGICERLEQFEVNTDWDRADWRAVDRFRREAQNQWRQIGPVNRKDQKTLERRYSQALGQINSHLNQERERDLHRRQALIRRVQGLVNSEDLRTAIAAAKQAQAEWQPTVQISRHQEQALWREFRAACDAIFGRRQAERRSMDLERQTNLAAKSALCEELEGLIAEKEESIVRARNRVQQIQQEWDSVGWVPKTAYKPVEQRFTRALKQFEQRCQQQLRTDELRELQVLRDKAHLCGRIEALLTAEQPDGAVLVEQARQEWASLSGLRKSLEEPVRRRFDAACQAVIEGGQARQSLLQTLEANLESKKVLCLRLEILAGAETPPEFVQEKMEYQIARLSESLAESSSTHSPPQAMEEARAIEREWYLTGTIPSEMNESLELRFQRALATLHEHRE